MIRGDAADAAAVDAAVTGHDAVLSALGQGRDGRSQMVQAVEHIVARDGAPQRSPARLPVGPGRRRNREGLGAGVQLDRPADTPRVVR